jgi:sugar phosphate isomerase/epimerase
MKNIFFTGFADEAGAALEIQIKATLELGWHAIEMRNVQAPGFENGNLHEISDPAFDLVADTLNKAGVRVNSLGSALCNGASKLDDPIEKLLASAQRAANRAVKLKADFIRIMSYPIGDIANLREEERYRRLREIVAIFAGTGTTVVHENCSNYGGMGWTYTLKLLENVPGLKLVFDMGNCAGDLDYTKPEPRPRQNAWEFYSKVRDHIAYVHVKDAVFDSATNKKVHVFPGEGSCYVREILQDLLKRGYQGGISIEPHMGAGLNDASLSVDENKYQTYVGFGKHLVQLLEKPASAEKSLVTA